MARHAATRKYGASILQSPCLYLAEGFIPVILSRFNAKQMADKRINGGIAELSKLHIAFDIFAMCAENGVHVTVSRIIAMHTAIVASVVGEKVALVRQHKHVANVDIVLIMKPRRDVCLTPYTQMRHVLQGFDYAVLLPSARRINVSGQVAFKVYIPFSFQII